MDDEPVSSFSQWGTAPTKTVLTAPSYVQAIVECQSPDGKPFIAVACRKGEIVLTSQDALGKIILSGKIKAPASMGLSVENFQIEYAVFDSISQHFFFVLHSPGDKAVYCVKQSDLETCPSDGVEVSVLIPAEQNKNRPFCGLTVDDERRILYSCNSEQGTIDLWLLADGTNLTATFVGSVDCQMSDNKDGKVEPWYCSIAHIDKPFHRLLLAVSDWENSCVLLYVNSDSTQFPISGKKLTTENSPSNSNGAMGFQYVGVIASGSDESKDVGTVNFPHQLCFDDSGNLLVTDPLNDRIQIFTAEDGDHFKVAWTSTCPYYHDRAIFFRDPKTRKPMALTNHCETVVCYE